MSSKTHILRRDDNWTFCHSLGRGPHSTVYAVDFEEVTDTMLSRPYVCKLCIRGFRKATGEA